MRLHDGVCSKHLCLSLHSHFCLLGLLSLQTLYVMKGEWGCSVEYTDSPGLWFLLPGNQITCYCSSVVTCLHRSVQDTSRSENTANSNKYLITCGSPAVTSACLINPSCHRMLSKAKCRLQSGRCHYNLQTSAFLRLRHELMQPYFPTLQRTCRLRN